MSKYLTRIYPHKSDWLFFQINTILNNINWNRAIKKAHKYKKKYKRDFFIIPISKTKLGVTDGRYPLNKHWFMLAGKEKRLKYSRLIKLAYYNTINNN